MSTLFLTEKRCFHCGCENKLPHTNPHITIVGPKDLDGRPAYTQRSAVYIWIQRCSTCGYCAQDIASGNALDKEFIMSIEYQSQLKNTHFPETANAFLAHLLIMKKEDLFADAGWDAVFASWICDDNGFIQGALKCRVKAIELFAEAKNRGLLFAASPIEESIYFIDLHRRTQQFDKALQWCLKELKNEGIEEKAWNILLYEKELIEKNDSSCHNDIDADETD